MTLSDVQRLTEIRCLLPLVVRDFFIERPCKPLPRHSHKVGVNVIIYLYLFCRCDLG